MSYTISNVKTDLTGILHGAQVTKLPSFYQLCRRAANKVMMMADLHTTERIVPMTNALYDSIYDYLAPDDLKVNKIFDIAPQLTRNNRDYNDQVNSRQFDIKRAYNTFSIRNNAGVKTLRINKPLYAPLLVHACDSLTADGAWAGTNDAGSLSIDTNFYLSGNGSIKFNLDGLTGTGTLTLTGAQAKNLATVKDVGALFMWLYFPDETRITSIGLKWGSSVSDYYSRTITAPHNMTGFAKYWNLLRFDWNGATVTGTPDEEEIDYAQVTITYTVGAAMNGLFMENIVAIRSVPFDLHYYSGYMFKDTTGQTWKEIPTTDSDIIAVDNDNYTLFLNELAIMTAQANQGEDGDFDFAFFKGELYGTKNSRGLYDIYTSNYPSKALIQVDEYYDMGYDDMPEDYESRSTVDRSSI